MPTLSQPRWSRVFARRIDAASRELAAILAPAAGTDLISLAGGLPDPLCSTRCRLMLAALDEHMPPRFTWTRPRGGFFTWLTGLEWLDTVDLARRARAAGLAFVPGRLFHPNGGGGDQLRLAYSLADDAHIEESVRRLGALISSTLENR